MDCGILIVPVIRPRVALRDLASLHIISGPRPPFPRRQYSATRHTRNRRAPRNARTVSPRCSTRARSIARLIRVVPRLWKPGLLPSSLPTALSRAATLMGVVAGLSVIAGAATARPPAVELRPQPAARPVAASGAARHPDLLVVVAAPKDRTLWVLAPAGSDDGSASTDCTCLRQRWRGTAGSHPNVSDASDDEDDVAVQAASCPAPLRGTTSGVPGVGPDTWDSRKPAGVCRAPKPRPPNP